MQNQLFNEIPAGVFPTDKSANIFECSSTKEVYIIQEGSVKKFEDISVKLKRELLKKYLANKPARKDLGHLGYTEGLKIFAKCMYGALDKIADFDEDGNLQDPDNYRCSDNCKCMLWKTKQIKYKDEVFTQRQLDCLELISQGLTDIEIADQMNISINSLSDYKRRLQKKLGTYCKTSTAVKAIKLRLVR